MNVRSSENKVQIYPPEKNNNFPHQERVKKTLRKKNVS